METARTKIKTIAIVCVVCLAIFYCGRTKITQVPIFIAPSWKRNQLVFVVSNPPSDVYSLLSLLSSHLDSFVPYDTLRKYNNFYEHHYYKETFSTFFFSKEIDGTLYDASDYWNKHWDDLLMKITVEAEFNKKTIEIYREEPRFLAIFLGGFPEEIKIELPLKADMPPYRNPKITVYGREKEPSYKQITFYVDGIREKKIEYRYHNSDYHDSLRDEIETIYKDGMREKEIIHYTEHYREKNRKEEATVVFFKESRREKETIHKDGSRKEETIIYKYKDEKSEVPEREERETIYEDGRRERETVYKDGKCEEEVLLPGEKE